MKKLTQLTAFAVLGAYLIFASATAQATVLFFEDFESDLSAWTGKPPGGTTSAQIETDPLDASNHALSFATATLGGDAFTVDTFLSPTGIYVLSFDYLGTCSASSPANCGGFLGYSFGLPGTHNWIAGTAPSFLSAGFNTQLMDTGAWTHVDLVFTVPSATPIHLMLEDFSLVGGGLGGDAYFDNIRLSVPEPGTLALLGISLLALGFLRRQKVSKA